VRIHSHRFNARSRPIRDQCANEFAPPAEFNAARLQRVVFALVCAAFLNIYITQPILSVLEGEFHASLARGLVQRVRGVAGRGASPTCLSVRWPTVGRWRAW
jgi:hypothetical protein